MDNLVARVLVYGDMHLCSKSYGAHRDYPAESKELFDKITSLVKEYEVTHLIGLGDFTYGRFTTLEYRQSIEDALIEQDKLVNGNHYELKGNHDEASYGMTERDFYIGKGLLKPCVNFDIGNVHFTAVDFGMVTDIKPNINLDEGHVNIVLSHNYMKFKDTRMPNYGKAIMLEDLNDTWFGVKYLICGHIHERYVFSGSYIKDNMASEMEVLYPGCLCRPSYLGPDTTTEGCVILIDIYADRVDVRSVQIDLWPIDKAFNIEEKTKQIEKKEEKESRIDISDIVSSLAGHERKLGDPVQMVEGMEGVPEKYRKKAVELLKQAMA